MVVAPGPVTVVFVMNVTSLDEARELLESLPFGQAKLLKFDLLPLGPLSPLQVLLDHPQPVGR